jgi:hypothetical protein
MEILLVFAQYPFLKVVDCALLFAFCPISSHFVDYFLSNASPTQIEDVRHLIVPTRNVDLLVGCYRITQDFEFILRALMWDEGLRVLVQDAIDARPAEFLNVACRLLSLPDGNSFVSVLEPFDYSKIAKVSIEENELFLVFRNCEPPRQTENLVEKAALIASSPTPDNALLNCFIEGDDHLLFPSMLSILLSKFNNIPFSLALIALGYPWLVAEAL